MPYYMFEFKSSGKYVCQSVLQQITEKHQPKGHGYGSCDDTYFCVRD